jgi:hypothetical protein
VQLELIRVTYRAEELADAVAFCARIAGATGKPVLGGPISAASAPALMAAGLDPQLIETWNACWNAPLWRLAAFLCPAKGDCYAYLGEIDARRTAQAVGGTGRRPRERSLFD